MFDVIQATVGAFGMFMPSLVATRHADPNDERKIADIRLGMLLAGGWSFIVAAHYANKTNSSTPYAYWIIGSAVMIALYEVSLRDQNDIDLRD